MRIYISSLLVIFICSCSSQNFKTGNGDAGQFILQQALVCGGHPAITNNLSSIDAHWRYFVDKDGMVMQLPRERFSEVCLFLQQAFGSPEQEPVNTKMASWVGMQPKRLA